MAEAPPLLILGDHAAVLVEGVELYGDIEIIVDQH
jgi:hypothetical protein